MNVSIHHAPTLRAVLEVLIQLPSEVRRFALEHVQFVAVGIGNGGVRGFALKASERQRAWTVVVAEGASHSTIAHEIAHAHNNHAAGAESERAAAAAAHDWGFRDDAADPVAAVDKYHLGRDRQMRVHGRLEGGALTIECASCGAPCATLSPVVPGMPAEVGVECGPCGKAGVYDLAALVSCQGCGQRATVTWSAEATPGRPFAVWACDCGVSVTRSIRSAPAVSDVIVAGRDEPPWSYYARHARHVLAINGHPAFARRQLTRALAEMDGDPHRQDVQEALAALERGDTAGAASLLERIAAGPEQRP